jgi:hypothetical protein
MQRRNRPGKRPIASLFRWLLLVAFLVLVSGGVLALLAPTLVTGYIRTYLQKDDFRRKAEEWAAARTGGSVRVAPLVWNDDNVSVTDVSADAPGWEVEAGGLHAALDFGAIRHGVWSIQNAGADELMLRHKADAGAGRLSNAGGGTFDSGTDEIPAFLRRYIPVKTRVSGFEVQRFLFEQGDWKIANSELWLGGWQGSEASLPAKLNGGKLLTPVKAPQQIEPLQFDLGKASLRVSSSQIQVSDAALSWKQNSEVTVRGTLKHDSGAWLAFVHAKAVPLDEFLDAWWKQRVGGRVEGDLELSGVRNAALVWKASAALKDGVLTGLPILDKLVTYTKNQRFKRMVLDICSASFRPEGDVLRIENIVVQSNGLLRIEGVLNIRGRQVDGDLMLGVTPETLSSIPGAESRVFVEGNPGGPPGLKWTRVHVAGSLDAPQEDLSNRLIGAAGMSLLFDTPGAVVGKGAETLLKPVLGGEAAQMPGKVIDGASKVIEGGVSTGAGIINNVLPIFPGK